MHKIFSEPREKKQEKRYITELENEEGEKITNYVDIIEEVGTFYKKLFEKENVKQECLDEVLSNVNVSLTDKERNTCERDISMEEIEETIIQTKPNKSLGSDGLTHEFYKTFMRILAPILLRLFRSMEENEIVPK